MTKQVSVAFGLVVLAMVTSSAAQTFRVVRAPARRVTTTTLPATNARTLLINGAPFDPPPKTDADPVAKVVENLVNEAKGRDALVRLRDPAINTRLTRVLF
jgi:hypothetical protein